MENNTTKHRNFNHTQVNKLNCAGVYVGLGIWYIHFRRPLTIWHSFQKAV